MAVLIITRKDVQIRDEYHCELAPIAKTMVTTSRVRLDYQGQVHSFCVTSVLIIHRGVCAPFYAKVMGHHFKWNELMCRISSVFRSGSLLSVKVKYSHDTLP